MLLALLLPDDRKGIPRGAPIDMADEQARDCNILYREVERDRKWVGTDNSDPRLNRGKVERNFLFVFDFDPEVLAARLRKQIPFVESESYSL